MRYSVCPKMINLLHNTEEALSLLGQQQFVWVTGFAKIYCDDRIFNYIFLKGKQTMLTITAKK